MKFIKDLSEKEYQEFWEKTPNNHFMQSYEWGQVNKKKKSTKPRANCLTKSKIQINP